MFMHLLWIFEKGGFLGFFCHVTMKLFFLLWMSSIEVNEIVSLLILHIVDPGSMSVTLVVFPRLFSLLFFPLLMGIGGCYRHLQRTLSTSRALRDDVLVLALNQPRYQPNHPSGLFWCTDNGGLSGYTEDISIPTILGRYMGC